MQGLNRVVNCFQNLCRFALGTTKRDHEHAVNPKDFLKTGRQLARKLIDVIIYGKVVKTVPAIQSMH